MKIFYTITFLILSFSLLTDSILLITAFLEGDRLHPQLLYHFPFNLIFVGFVYYLLNKENQTKKQ